MVRSDRQEQSCSSTSTSTSRTQLRMRWFLCMLTVLAVLRSANVEVAASNRAGESPPRVMVRLLLLEAPTAVQTTTDLSTVGAPLTSLDALTAGGSIYLEAWCQSTGSHGITTAVVDLTYDPTNLDTSPAAASLAAQWALLAFDVVVDSANGRIDDLGGNNLEGLGLAPTWAKIGAARFQIDGVPLGGFQFCSEPAGGPLVFAIRSEGAVGANEVDFGCVALTCESDANCDDGLFCTGAEHCAGDHCASDGDPCPSETSACDEPLQECVCSTLANPTGFEGFPACMSGPGLPAGEACQCAALDPDLDVDLRDFSILQRVFMPNL